MPASFFKKGSDAEYFVDQEIDEEEAIWRAWKAKVGLGGVLLIAGTAAIVVSRLELEDVLLQNSVTAAGAICALVAIILLLQAYLALKGGEDDCGQDTSMNRIEKRSRSRSLSGEIFNDPLDGMLTRSWSQSNLGRFPSPT